MPVNKMKVAKPTITAAKRKLLNAIAPAAYAEGQARGSAVAAIKAACGRAPSMALYIAARTEYQIGRVAFALENKGLKLVGHNSFESYARFVMLECAAPDAKKLRDGQRRRTKQEEQACVSGRVLWSRAFKETGCVIPETRGGANNSKGRKPRASKANAATPVAANDVLSPPTSMAKAPKLADREAVMKFASNYAAFLLATVSKNSRIVPPQVATACQTFQDAIKKLG